MRQQIGKMLFFLFSAGAAIGILAAFFWRGYFLDEFEVMQEGLFKSLDEKLYSRVGLFLFLFWQRMKQGVFLLFLFMTSIGLPFLYFITVFAGMAGGMYLFASCCQYGISGSVVFFFGFFPQCIFYLPLLYLLIRQGFGISLDKVSKPVGRKMHGRNRGIVSFRGIGKILLWALLLLLGCFAEACFNPPLLKWILSTIR